MPVPRNIGLDLVRVTEAAALAAAPWMGRGDRDRPDQEAAAAMRREMDRLPIDGCIVIGESRPTGVEPPLPTGQRVGTGEGVAVDVVVDPVDGRNLLAQGLTGSLAVAAVAPQGAMVAADPARYMDKIVADRTAADALVPECLDAPAAWTLSLLARVKDKRVQDLVVFILDRPRHRDLIDEVRTAGARVMLQPEGDLAGAILAASPHHPNVDLLMDVGGVPEGVMAACAVKAYGGAMLGRLAPQSDAERAAVAAAGLDTDAVWSADDLVAGREIFFAATGITDGPVARGVQYRRGKAETHSVALRCETNTRRIIYADHALGEPRTASGH